MTTTAIEPWHLQIKRPQLGRQQPLVLGRVPLPRGRKVWIDDNLTSAPKAIGAGLSWVERSQVWWKLEGLSRPAPVQRQRHALSFVGGDHRSEELFDALTIRLVVGHPDKHDRPIQLVCNPLIP